MINSSKKFVRFIVVLVKLLRLILHILFFLKFRFIFTDLFRKKVQSNINNLLTVSSYVAGRGYELPYFRLFIRQFKYIFIFVVNIGKIPVQMLESKE